jgi:hypothetical protein
MTCMIAGRARIGFVIMVATALTAGICGDAAAKAGKGRSHSRGFIYEGRDSKSAKRLQLASRPSGRPGPMRYYGGPKAPMWRGPVEN